MEFTPKAYRELLELLRQKGYFVCGYHNYHDFDRCVILRHDVDQSLEKAVELAEVEAEVGVSSTWFVLLRTDFYNPASKRGQAALQRLLELGHEIGLHFDEMAYEDDRESVENRILQEAEILSRICGKPVTAVSMHRPSQRTLEADLQIPGMVNSYGKTFFRDFKYLSDSRRNWREPVMDIVNAGTYDRLHILTHAFWYHDQEQELAEAIRTFVRQAAPERYRQMAENIRDLKSVLREDEI